MSVVVLGHDSRVAVRHTIPSQVSGTHTRCDDFEDAGSLRWRTPKPKATALRLLEPTGRRHALPAGLAGWRRGRGEVKQARLRSCVRFDLEGHVVCPRDSRSGRYAHDPCGAERPALLTARVVFGEVPGIGYATAFGVQRDTGVIALGWRHHSPAPILAYDRHPDPGQIELRAGTSSRRRSTLTSAASTPLLRTSLGATLSAITLRNAALSSGTGRGCRRLCGDVGYENRRDHSAVGQHFHLLPPDGL